MQRDDNTIWVSKFAETLTAVEEILKDKESLSASNIEKLENLPALMMKVTMSGERISYRTTIARARLVHYVTFKEASLSYYYVNKKPILQRITIKGGYDHV